MKDGFMGASFYALKYDKEAVGGTDYNMPNSRWRSELNFTCGRPLLENIFVLQVVDKLVGIEICLGMASTTQKERLLG